MAHICLTSNARSSEQFLEGAGPGVAAYKVRMLNARGWPRMSAEWRCGFNGSPENDFVNMLADYLTGKQVYM